METGSVGEGTLDEFILHRLDELVQMDQETLKLLTFSLRTLEKLILSEGSKACFHVCFQLDIVLLLG